MTRKQYIRNLDERKERGIMAWMKHVWLVVYVDELPPPGQEDGSE